MTKFFVNLRGLQTQTLLNFMHGMSRFPEQYKCCNNILYFEVERHRSWHERL
jgi:hypothetical protein